MKKNGKWFMAGTEKTGEYLVVVIGSLGKVGYRDLGNGSFRVRVEPVDAAAQTVLAPSFQSWKQPGFGQLRFSLVAYGTKDLQFALRMAIAALAKANHLQVNPKAPKGTKELVAQVKAEVEAAAKAAEEAKKAAEAKAKAAPKPKKVLAKKAPAKKAKPAAKKPTKKAA